MEVVEFMQNNAISSTVVEFMQDNTIPIAVAGAIVIACFILAKLCNGTKKSTKFHNVANFEAVNNKKVKNHKEKYADKINLKKYDDVKNVGNLKIINNEEIEGGETEVCRTFG